MEIRPQRRGGGAGERSVWRRRRHGAGAPADRLVQNGAEAAFANCVAVIFPLCALSAVIYLLRTGLRLVTALPYLVGGLAGGFVGGKLFGKGIRPLAAAVFGVFLVYGGVRYLL